MKRTKSGPSVLRVPKKKECYLFFRRTPFQSPLTMTLANVDFLKGKLCFLLFIFLLFIFFGNPRQNIFEGRPKIEHDVHRHR